MVFKRLQAFLEELDQMILPKEKYDDNDDK